jgi:hypothetical protein
MATPANPDTGLSGGGFDLGRMETGWMTTSLTRTTTRRRCGRSRNVQDVPVGAHRGPFHVEIRKSASDAYGWLMECAVKEFENGQFSSVEQAFAALLQAGDPASREIVKAHRTVS